VIGEEGHVANEKGRRKALEPHLVVIVLCLLLKSQWSTTVPVRCEAGGVLARRRGG
jgi:hypothetical protein